MTMMRQRFGSICLAGFLTAFGHGQVAPLWTRVLPEAPGRIYAVGTAAVAPSAAKAMEQAAQNARLEVIARLKVAIQGETLITESSAQQQRSRAAAVGTSQKVVRQNSTMTVKATGLPGLVVAERFLDESAGSAYALAYLDTASACQSLEDQLGALEKDWADLQAAPVGPGLRSAISRLQRISTLEARAGELESEAALLVAAQLPVVLRARAQALRLDLKRAAMRSQQGLTMGARVKGGDLDADVLALLRNAALQQGFTWVANGPAITLLIELRSANQGLNLSRKTWYDVDASIPDLVGTRALIRISLADADGTAQDGFDLELKGVGTDLFSSERALRKDLARVLPVRFAEFLRGLLR